MLPTPPNCLDYLSTIETSLPNKYRFIGKIAEGAHAIVSKAQIKFNKAAGVFALKRNREQEIEKVVTMIDINEVKILRKLRDEKHVVKFIELLRDHQEFTLVLEYCRVDLAKIIHHDLHYAIPLTEDVKKNLLLQLFTGLKAIHSHYVVHRDLKPSNVLLSMDGTVKIADFGCSMEMGVLPELKTDVRTVWYLSPEICLGHGNYDQSVDIWSAGCMAVEFFTREPALFQGTDKLTQMEKISELCGFCSESVWPEAKGFPNYESFHKALGKYTANNLPNYLLEITRDEGAAEFLGKLLKLNATERITADQAINDVYFQSAPGPSPNLNLLLRDLDRRNLC